MDVHLVDGTFELFRAYYGAPPSKTKDGLEVGATRAFIRSMLSLIKEPNVTHIGVAFDHVIESFRNDLFPGYKTGEGIEQPLASQFPLVEEASRALGLVTWPMVEFEADDMLASAAVKFASDPKVKRVIICSPDKDLTQVIDGKKIFCYDRIRRKMMDYNKVIEKFGIEPQSIPDYLGLVGDSADGIPGIPRWGAKSSMAILSKFKTIDKIPENEENWGIKVRGASTLAQNLREQKQEAELYKKLATLRLDVPITESLNDLAWEGGNKSLAENFLPTISGERLLAQISRWR